MVAVLEEPRSPLLLLDEYPLFQGVAQDHTEVLQRAVRVRSFKEGAVIFHQGDLGDGLFFVRSGTVKITVQASDGREVTLSLLSVGDWFGETASLDGGIRADAAVALQRTSTLFLHRDDFMPFLERCPQVAMRVAELLCRRLRSRVGTLTDLTFLDAHGRIAKSLLDLAERLGAPTHDGIVIDLVLSQQDLANLAGISRESANRVIKLYRDRGYLTLERQRIKILKMGALQRRAHPTFL